MSTLSTSVSITQDDENGPATVTHISEWGRVVLVVDADGKINDYTTIQYLATVVGYLLSVHSLVTAHTPSVQHIAATTEKLMLGACLQLGAVMAEVGQQPVFAHQQLRKGWNYPGWLTEKP